MWAAPRMPQRTSPEAPGPLTLRSSRIAEVVVAVVHVAEPHRAAEVEHGFHAGLDGEVRQLADRPVAARSAAG